MDYVILIGPIVTAIIVILGWRRLHSDASKRDLENWRRTTLATAVTEIIADAEELLQTNVEKDDKELMRKRRVTISSLEQKKSLVNMCDDGMIWECCSSYIFSVRQLMIALNDADRDSNYEEISRLIGAKENQLTHLTRQLPISIKLKKTDPYDPMYAAIERSERYSETQIRLRKIVRKINNGSLSNNRQKPWTVKDEYMTKVIQ